MIRGLVRLAVVGGLVAAWLNEKGRVFEMEAELERLNAQVRGRIVPELHETTTLLGRAIDVLNSQGGPMPEQEQQEPEGEQPQEQPDNPATGNTNPPEGGDTGGANDPGGAV